MTCCELGGGAVSCRDPGGVESNLQDFASRLGCAACQALLCVHVRLCPLCACLFSERVRRVAHLPICAACWEGVEACCMGAWPADCVRGGGMGGVDGCHLGWVGGSVT